MERSGKKSVILLCVVGLISSCTPKNQTPNGLPQTAPFTKPVTPMMRAELSASTPPAILRLSPLSHSEPVKNLFEFEVLKRASSRQQLLDHYGRVSAFCTELTLGDSHLLCFHFDVGSGIFIWKGAVYLQDGSTWLLVDQLPGKKEPGGGISDTVSGGYRFTPMGETALQVAVGRIDMKSTGSKVSGKLSPSKGAEMVYREVETLSLDTLKERARHSNSGY